jgi:hypothetical protein
MTQKYQGNSMGYKPGNGGERFRNREGGQEEMVRRGMPEYVVDAVSNALVSHMSRNSFALPKYVGVFKKVRHDAMVGAWMEARAECYSKPPKKYVTKSYTELDPVLGYYKGRMQVITEKPDAVYTRCTKNIAKAASKEREVFTVITNSHASVVKVNPGYLEPSEESKNTGVMYYYYMRVE